MVMRPVHSKFPREGSAYFGRGAMLMVISGEGITVDVSAFKVDPRTRSLAFEPEDRDLTESPRARSLAISIPDRPVE